MAQVATRKRGAGLTITLAIQRRPRALERRAFHVDSTGRKPGRSVTSVARCRDAVEQIHAASDTLEQVGRKTDAHKITGDRRRHGRVQALEHPVHHFFGFSNRQPSNGDAAPRTLLQDSFDRAGAKVIVAPALNDGPESLTLLSIL